MYSGRSGLMWEKSTQSGEGFFLPTKRWIFSNKGDRVVLVSTGENRTDPIISVHGEWGALIYQSTDALLWIRNVALSPDGKYVALFAVRGGVGGNDEHLFRVITVDTGQVSDKSIDPASATSMYFRPADKGFALFVNGTVSAVLP